MPSPSTQVSTEAAGASTGGGVQVPDGRDTNCVDHVPVLPLSSAAPQRVLARRRSWISVMTEGALIVTVPVT